MTLRRRVFPVLRFGWLVALPRASEGISRAGGRASLLAALLSCSRSVSRSTTSGRLRLAGSAPPPHGFTTVAFRQPASRLAVRHVRSSSPSYGQGRSHKPGPCFRVLPGHPRARTMPHTPLSRGFFPHRHNPAIQSHPSRGFHPPGHVASSRFLPASTPCSLNGLPGVSQPGAPSGFSLQSLTWQRSRRLSAAHPLLRLAPRVRKHRSKAKTGFPFPPSSPFLSVRIGRSVPVSQTVTARAGSPARGLAPGSFSLRNPASKLAGSAESPSGTPKRSFVRLLPVGARHHRVSPAGVGPGSPGLHPPWGILHPEPRASPATVTLARSGPSTCRFPFPCFRAGPFRRSPGSRTGLHRNDPPLVHFGNAPSEPAFADPDRVLLPVLQSFKEHGMWACLFRGCRPLRGLRPRPFRAKGLPFVPAGFRTG
jgi:hypothetical protein